MLMANGEKGRRYTAGEVADFLNASRAHVSKVVSRLVELGVVDAVKGRGGGIYLVEGAVDRSVGELLRTLENHEVVDCEGTQCPLIPACMLRGQLAQAQEAFFASLDSVTVGDLIPEQPGALAELSQDD